MNTERNKYLINCQSGAQDLERATISFILAVSAAKENDAAVFITADASDLCVQGGTDGLVAEGHEPLQNLVNQFLELGGKIWLCPVCAKTRGIGDRDLIAGVEIAGAPKTMAYLDSGAKLLA